MSKIPDLSLGICSGNLPRIGWKKLESAGLTSYFKDKIAGWGLYRSRADILRDAISQGEQHIHGEFDWVIHIGDTPEDVKAAIAVGALGVMVEVPARQYDDVPQPCSVLRNLDIDFDEIMNIVCLGKHKSDRNEMTQN
jgi:phosphoglycolate phosphatase-like HAD superfamily hydrolase